MASDTLILGTNKGLIMLECNAQGSRFIRDEFTGIPVSYAAADPRTGILWAGLDHGHWGQKLHRSRDRGATWEEIPAPTYPEGAELKEGVPATLSYIWLITPGPADQPGRLYIGTEPGGLFQSDDGGDTFEFVDSLWNHPSRKNYWFGGWRDHPGLCSLMIDPRNSDRILIGISVGGVYESTDGGQTWAGRNKGLSASYLPEPEAEYGHDPHLVVMSPANPDVLWMQNHCGVFRSCDGGQSWQDISEPGGPVYFGFAVAADEHDADTAWVVPGIADEKRMAVNRALCVCRTEDGGNTWTALRNGLPQENCYDLVYRHALDLRGDRLAFGTTTGNLFISDDRGDSWRCLGNHFPPIYSVRFV